MPDTLSQADFERVRDVVFAATSYVVEADKHYLVETRLGELAMRRGFASSRALIAAMEAQPADSPMHQLVVEAILNNETTFFRDITCFHALRDKVLPALLAARADARRLTIWSGACSTGQEPYSLAMMLAERAEQLAGWTIEIVATDFSHGVLERARSGRYSQAEINRGLPAQMLVKHFEQSDGEWVLSDEIRRQVTFEAFNLKNPWTPVIAADLVLVRNVMIYWHDDDRRDLLSRIAYALRPTGCLVLGGAELPLGTSFTRWGDGAPCCFKSSSAEERP